MFTVFVKRMRNSVVVFTMSIFLLTGCMSSYRSPETSEATALINFNAQSTWSTKNAIIIYSDPVNCKNGKIAISPSIISQYTRAKQPVKIPANKLFTFRYHHYTISISGYPGHDYSICDFVVTFMPKPGGHYNVKLDDGDGQYCRISLSEIKYTGSLQQQTSTPVIFMLREYDEPGAFLRNTPIDVRPIVCSDTDKFDS